MGFRQAGIDVYHDDQRKDIRPVVEDLIAGNWP
jgi:predicted Fe-Mo cluster-binding NifX family protein